MTLGCGGRANTSVSRPSYPYVAQARVAGRRCLRTAFTCSHALSAKEPTVRRADLRCMLARTRWQRSTSAKKARGVTMSHFLLSQGLSTADIEMLCIVGIGIIPSIIGLALCCVSLGLSDEGYVLPKPRDDRQDGPQRV